MEDGKEEVPPGSLEKTAPKSPLKSPVRPSGQKSPRKQPSYKPTKEELKEQLREQKVGSLLVFHKEKTLLGDNPDPAKTDYCKCV